MVDSRIKLRGGGVENKASHYILKIFFPLKYHFVLYIAILPAIWYKSDIDMFVIL